MRAMCGVQLKDRERAKEFLLILRLNEIKDQLLWQTMYDGIGRLR